MKKVVALALLSGIAGGVSAWTPPVDVNVVVRLVDQNGVEIAASQFQVDNAATLLTGSTIALPDGSVAPRSLHAERDDDRAGVMNSRGEDMAPFTRTHWLTTCPPSFSPNRRRQP